MLHEAGNGLARNLDAIINYEGSKERLRTNLTRAVVGGLSILALNTLDAPAIVDIAAYLYTAKKAYETYRDLQVL